MNESMYFAEMAREPQRRNEIQSIHELNFFSSLSITVYTMSVGDNLHSRTQFWLWLRKSKPFKWNYHHTTKYTIYSFIHQTKRKYKIQAKSSSYYTRYFKINSRKWAISRITLIKMRQRQMGKSYPWHNRSLSSS